MGALTKIFGTHSERELKRIYPLVDKVESYRDSMQKLSDEELRNKTKEYKERLEKGETLDDLLPEAFATVREAAKRVLGMEHYRVQIIGGIILHQGRIAEMKTGEGKTLVSTLPAYLNALEGKGVCIVTVNDYLAKRDSEWMGQVHEFLGLKVGVVLNSMTNDERREAYNCDITYVTNNELGFDYLRDNMVIYKEQLVQRGLHYAIIDEVDSVLIDEARTPLIISGQSGKSTKLYEACDILATQLKRGEDVPEYSKMDAIMGIEQEETGENMSYTALYRKFRPDTFEDVKGQDHIIKTLQNQIKADRIGHAYLFCGTRGTGKTTVAKIFAKAVNCEHPVDGSPCGECAMCKAVAADAGTGAERVGGEETYLPLSWDGSWNLCDIGSGLTR